MYESIRYRYTIAIAVTLVAVFIAAACSRGHKSVDPRYSTYITNAMKNMRPGDWVLYYVNKDLQFRMQVVERDSKGVTIEYLSYLSEAPRDQGTLHRFEFRQVERNLERGLDIYGKTPYLEMKFNEEETKAGDRKIPSEKWAIKTPSAVIEQWFSNEIPVWGLTRQRRNSRTALLVRTWGRAGERIDWPSDLMDIRLGEISPSINNNAQRKEAP